MKNFASHRDQRSIAISRSLAMEKERKIFANTRRRSHEFPTRCNSFDAPLQPDSTFQERSVLPKYYTRVAPVIIRPSPSSPGSVLDCSSNTTLVTNASPFNSQTALIAEKRHFSGDVGKSTNHYYAENLRSQKALNGSRIYDPLDRGQDDYRQLDPLLTNNHSPSTSILMDSQDVKPPKDAQDPVGLPSTEKSAEPSRMHYATQVNGRIIVIHVYVLCLSQSECLF